MSMYNTNEPMLDMFIFETSQNTEQLEKIILSGEKTNGFTKDEIDEIFRIMHTIKGSSAMMSYGGISSLSHKIEDMFFYIRENPEKEYDCSLVSDLILESVDFISAELEKIKQGSYVEKDAAALVQKISKVLEAVKSGEASGDPPDTADTDGAAPAATAETAISDAANLFRVIFYFQEGCDMENIRAFNLVFLLKKHAAGIRHYPENIDDNGASSGIIRENGFTIFFKTDLSIDEVKGFFSQEVFLKDFEVTHYESEGDFEREMAACFGTQDTGEAPQKDEVQNPSGNTKTTVPVQREQAGSSHQSIISVKVSKLDMLMDMIGELVIAESMVVHNPDLGELLLENFQKAAHQLHKITSELQDLAMSMRMVPLTNTFHKMNRIVRDMSKKFNKDVVLEISGEETEVDKNIIDHISDPLMHLVRNALDHGIEPYEERLAKGKSAKGTVMLGARNEGGEILIFLRDDGKGLNKAKIIQRAKENSLLTKPESDMSEREIFNLIFHPGFSTSDTVTEYSGRGVGMDVVLRNIEELGGRVTVDSVENKGTQFTFHFPMTLAIIEGMTVRVGDCVYTLPITVIKETIKPNVKDIISDPQNNEMILFRGECCPIVRLHKLYGVKADTETISEGIIVMVESGEKMAGIFVDELIGENQVVVKALPKYLNSITGIAGCTILGDGSISLILDVAGLAA